MSTDSEIIRRSQATPSAFAEMFERHARVIGAFAQRRIGDDAADDVLSETFLIAFRRRSDFDLSWESARPWLLGIASRVIKKHRAAEARHWKAMDAADRSHSAASSGEFDDVSARVDASEAVKRLAPRIALLSRKDRDTLFLYAWGDLTYEEIAVALAVPVGTVRSRLNRVRRKLAPPGSGAAARLTWMGKEQADGYLG